MTATAKRILVVGSYNVGLTCQTDRVPVWGETLIGSGFSESNGGKGANQAVAAARLGASVSFVGCLGEDRYGDDGLEMLNREGIDTSDVRRTNHKNTGVGIILLNSKGDNCIVVDPGANSELDAKDMESLTSVNSADVVVFQLETPLETVKRGMEIAKSLGKQVILNPAPANRKAMDLLPLATVVNPNESELLILNGKDPGTELTDDRCEQLAQALLQRGPTAIVVTRGENGAMIVTQDGTEVIPAVSVDAVDTTGAGDAFTGALAVALAEQKGLKKAVQFAAIAGSYSVTKRDVIPGLATREELKRFAIENGINGID